MLILLHFVLWGVANYYTLRLLHLEPPDNFSLSAYQQAFTRPSHCDEHRAVGPSAAFQGDEQRAIGPPPGSEYGARGPCHGEVGSAVGRRETEAGTRGLTQVDVNCATGSQLGDEQSNAVRALQPEEGGANKCDNVGAPENNALMESQGLATTKGTGSSSHYEEIGNTTPCEDIGGSNQGSNSTGYQSVPTRGSDIGGGGVNGGFEGDEAGWGYSTPARTAQGYGNNGCIN